MQFEQPRSCLNSHRPLTQRPVLCDAVRLNAAQQMQQCNLAVGYIPPLTQSVQTDYCNAVTDSVPRRDSSKSTILKAAQCTATCSLNVIQQRIQRHDRFSAMPSQYQSKPRLILSSKRLHSRQWLTQTVVTDSTQSGASYHIFHFVKLLSVLNGLVSIGPWVKWNI